VLRAFIIGIHIGDFLTSIMFVLPTEIQKKSYECIIQI